MLGTAVIFTKSQQIARESLNIYQAYINEDDIMFIRHYGKFEGAESFNALLATLASNPGAAQLKAVCFDYRAVTEATLEDSDRANDYYLLKKLASYGQNVYNFKLIRVIDAENVVVNDILRERNRRVAKASANFESFDEVLSMSDGLKALALPADYCIEYPTEK
jgi:hypothetical protein